MREIKKLKLLRIPLFLLLFLFLPTEVSATGTNDCYKYILSDEEITITWVDDGVSGDIIIPSEIDEYPVVKISSSAFANKEDVMSVVIPDTVRSIGNDAFRGCTSLESVKMGNGLTEISSRSFYKCSALKMVEFGVNVTKIGQEAFYGCTDLETVIWPNALKEIRGFAFCNCTSLKILDMPDTVISIGAGAFEGAGITYLAMSNNTAYIDAMAFMNCSNLSAVYLPKSLKSIGSFVFYGCKGIKDVFYQGSQSDWSTAPFDEDDEEITFATIHYNSVKPKYNPFTDIDANQFYYDAVLWARENNITQGLTSTTFCPDDSCTRAQVVTFLWRAMGSPEPSGNALTFKDVSETKHKNFYKAIQWATEQNITNGYQDGSFRPDRPVTRAEFVTFLYRANQTPVVQNPINPFADVSSVTHKNFISAILWAYENNITFGKDATHFQPDITCTRGHVVTFLYRNLAS